VFHYHTTCDWECFPVQVMRCSLHFHTYSVAAGLPNSDTVIRWPGFPFAGNGKHVCRLPTNYFFLANFFLFWIFNTDFCITYSYLNLSKHSFNYLYQWFQAQTIYTYIYMYMYMNIYVWFTFSIHVPYWNKATNAEWAIPIRITYCIDYVFMHN